MVDLSLKQDREYSYQSLIILPSIKVIYRIIFFTGSRMSFVKTDNKQLTTLETKNSTNQKHQYSKVYLSTWLILCSLFKGKKISFLS